MEKISAQHGRYVNTEGVIFIQTSSLLVTYESFRSALFSGELRTSIVEMRMPKGLLVDFSVVEEWRGILSILRVDDIEDELSQLVEEVEQDGPWMRRGAFSSVIGY